MARLYRLSEVEDDADNISGTKLGIQNIRREFTSAPAREVIERWYDGTAPHRTDLFDTTPANPALSVLNARITEAAVQVGGTPTSAFSSSGIHQPVTLLMQYAHPTPVERAGTIPFRFVIFHQDGHPYLVEDYDLQVNANTIGGSILFTLWEPSQEKPAPGQHVAYIYEGGRKVAQVDWNVTA